MKKLILAAALFAFGAGYSQTDPKQAPQQTQNPAQTVPDKTNQDAEIQNDVINRQATPATDVQPRKDELKTRDHVKSTPDPAVLKDTINQKKKPVAKKSRKKRN